MVILSPRPFESGMRRPDRRPKICAWRGLRGATLSYACNGMPIRSEARLHDDFPTFRREDLRLVSGHGQYADDLYLAHAAHAVMVRSPHAHAAIGSMDVANALAYPGVLAVLSGADALADGLQTIPHPTGSSKVGSDI